MPDMINLGVIGLGGRISNLIKNCFAPAAEEGVRVAAVVDPDVAGARSRLSDADSDARFYESIEEMMGASNLDALAIGTRCNLHAPYATKLAEYELPIFLEKPVAINMDQAIALEHAFETSKAPVLVSFPLRVSPLHELAKSLLTQGAVGTPHHILGTNYVPYGTAYWEQQYRIYEITGGLFLQKATHDFDYMMDLMNSSIKRVSANAHYGGIFGGDKSEDLRCSECEERHSCLESPENRVRSGSGGPHDHLCVFSRAAGTIETGTNEDTSSALLEFDSGAHGVYTQVFFTRRDAGRRGAVISGYDGTIDFDWYRNDLIRTRHHEPFTDRIEAGKGMSHFGGDSELARNFIAMIEGREESKADIWAGLRSVYSCLAAREAAISGLAQDVRQPGAIA